MPEKAPAIFANVRKLYRDGLKSSNKAYLDDAPARAKVPLIRFAVAGMAIHEMRAASRTSDEAYIAYREDLLQEMTAGNCEELALAAMDFAFQEGLAAQVWSYGARTETMDMTHVVAVVARSEDELEALSPPFDLTSEAASRVCVIDVWGGLCCALNEYQERFEGKMLKWDRERKGIFNKATDAFVSPAHPEWLGAVRSFAKDAVVEREKLPLHALGPAETHCQDEPSPDRSLCARENVR